MKAFITFFETKDGEIINHGTFERGPDLTSFERVELAKANGVPDSWTHCRIWNEGQVWAASGHPHHFHYEEGQPHEWFEVDEQGNITERELG